MPGMREKIARAICGAASDGHDPDEIVTHKAPPFWSKLPADPNAPEHDYWNEEQQESFYQWKRWRLYEQQADAVLDAMREPDEGMVEAGEGQLNEVGLHASCYDVTLCFTAMIDYARTPPEGA